MSGLIDDIEEVEASAPDIISAAEDVAAVIQEAGSSDATISIISKIESSIEDLLKHMAALISHHKQS